MFRPLPLASTIPFAFTFACGGEPATEDQALTIIGAINSISADLAGRVQEPRAESGTAMLEVGCPSPSRATAIETWSEDGTVFHTAVTLERCGAGSGVLSGQFERTRPTPFVAGLKVIELTGILEYGENSETFDCELAYREEDFASPIGSVIPRFVGRVCGYRVLADLSCGPGKSDQLGVCTDVPEE